MIFDEKLFVEFLESEIQSIENLKTDESYKLKKDFLNNKEEQLRKIQYSIDKTVHKIHELKRKYFKNDLLKSEKFPFEEGCKYLYEDISIIDGLEYKVSEILTLKNINCYCLNPYIILEFENKNKNILKLHYMMNKDKFFQKPFAKITKIENEIKKT